MEEIVQWGLVQYLSQLEGGGGGYGAKKPEPGHHGALTPSDHGSLQITSVEVQPGIWEGVYLMGWFWSALDCIYIWWSLRPVPALDSTPVPDDHGFTTNSRPQSYHSWRKEHAKRRSADSTIRTIRGLSKTHDFLYANIDQTSNEQDRHYTTDDSIITRQELVGKFDERASSPELSRRSIREEDNDAGDEETSATDNDNDILDSPITPTTYRPAYHAAVPTQLPRPIPDDEDDDQEESTPTQQKHNARFLAAGSVTSDSDYFGRREPAWTFSNPISPKRDSSRRLSILASDSETEGPISGAQTPLLSSSIPLDQEQTSLLSHPLVASYGSTQISQPPLGSLPLPPPEMHMNQQPQTSPRPFITSHPSYLSITTGDEAEDESDTQGKGGSLGRAYPSHPAFSSSYIHRHFPSSTISNTTCGQNTPTNALLRLSRPKLATSQSLPLKKGKTRRPRSYPGISQEGTLPIGSMIDLVTQSHRHINGVDAGSVSYVLAVLWAIIASFEHIGYGLWFVWFPTLVFEHTVQGWSVVFLVGIAFSRGVYVAQTDSGWITV
ncbi:hypothetical protein ABW20_dc0107083 [Dactylellina cionopaga]|nr:hypothetical protein ABW20_dc0107083 [Dactylellina cionopaga]